MFILCFFIYYLTNIGSNKLSCFFVFLFVFRCALHATLPPRRPTSPTPSLCSPSCGRLIARAAVEPALRPRCLWRTLLLPTPPHRDSALSGPPRPPTTSPSGCHRPLPQATTHSITTTITCTSRPRGRPSPSPPTASRRPSFQPCMARDETLRQGYVGRAAGVNWGEDTLFNGAGIYSLRLWMAKGERRGTLSFNFLKMNNLSSFGDLVLLFYLLSISFLSKPGKNHYD